MENILNGRRIAILVTDGFEQVEMTGPRKALEDAGAQTDLIAPERRDVQGMHHDSKGDCFPVDAVLDSVKADAPTPHSPFRPCWPLETSR